MTTRPILRVALDIPVRKHFDYLPPSGTALAELQAAVRVRVPFGRSTRIGIIVEVVNETALAPSQLRRALELIDTRALVPPRHLAFLAWAAGYYHHPVGEVWATALPRLLRLGRPARQRAGKRYRITTDGAAVADAGVPRAPRQTTILRRLAAAPAGLSDAELGKVYEAWRRIIQRLVANGWVAGEDYFPLQAPAVEQPVTINIPSAAQAAVVAAIGRGVGGFEVFLLEGVTGSGKTEVYLQCVADVIESGGQVLVLIPEIGLTDQTVQRFQARFRKPMAVFHSGLSDSERLSAWLAAREGRVSIVIGTRSAIWTPLPALGLIVVDEEHDGSYKQQDGLRYSARDVAVARGKHENIPVVLGSATPSLESLHNARRGRYHLLRLAQRIHAAQPPSLELLDLRKQVVHGGLSQYLLELIEHHLQRGEQVLLFLNRRGYAPVVFCPQCGWSATCQRCDARMIYHRASDRLRCHHCGGERRYDFSCADCAAEAPLLIGQGTEQLEEVLKTQFPDRRVLRIDRDTTRPKGAMGAALARIHSGDADILVGTQMLSKGHDFPAVSLVAVIDADDRLYDADFRAGERLAQLIVQVAGRAGRRDAQGRVIIQTRSPQHAVLTAVLNHGYPGFAESALTERSLAELPPFAAFALLRAEATRQSAPGEFLRRVCERFEAAAEPGVQLLGPVAPPMERRAGRYRSQLLLSAKTRPALSRALDNWLPLVESVKEQRSVRWSLDVDPQEMF